MKTTVLAIGSRGDVQPAIALGKGLAARGARPTTGSIRERLGCAPRPDKP
ncbi:glycosyltransferase [Sorangium sp. So ce136]